MDLTTTAPVADTATDPLITPPAALLTQVTNPQTSQTDYAFPLQTAAWIKMQNVVRTALSFPLTTDDFTKLYGTFADETSVTQAVAVLGQVNTTSAEYGDPTTLISQISAFQQAGTAPDSIYGNAVWLAAQTIEAAQQIVSLLQQGLTDIGQETDPAQRIEDLKELLQGDGSVSSYATTLSGQIGAFQTKTSTFYTTLNSELTGPTNSVQVYLNQGSNVLSDAKAIVKQDAQSIHAMTDTINELNKEYIGFTTSACVSPLLFLIPWFGPAIAVADAITFGVLAAKVKQQMDALRDKMSGMKADEAKKAALVTQLTGFNSSMQDVEGDGTDFLDAIGQLVSGWGAFESQIQLRLSSLTVADVEDWSAFMDKINFQAAVAGWQLIATKAEAFYLAGFVQFTTPPNSGN